MRNIYLKNKTERKQKRKYIKQQNYWVLLLRKSKTEYYSSLHVNSITDNKRFCKIIKPSLPDKVTPTEKITLIDNDDIVKIDDGTARVLKTLFSNIINVLKIPYYNSCNPLTENVQGTFVFKALVKQ